MDRGQKFEHKVNLANFPKVLRDIVTESREIQKVRDFPHLARRAYSMSKL